jgi:hypothetical protein
MNKIGSYLIQKHGSTHGSLRTQAEQKTVTPISRCPDSDSDKAKHNLKETPGLTLTRSNFLICGVQVRGDRPGGLTRAGPRVGPVRRSDSE